MAEDQLAAARELQGSFRQSGTFRADSHGDGLGGRGRQGGTTSNRGHDTLNRGRGGRGRGGGYSGEYYNDQSASTSTSARSIFSASYNSRSSSTLVSSDAGRSSTPFSPKEHQNDRGRGRGGHFSNRNTARSELGDVTNGHVLSPPERGNVYYYADETYDLSNPVASAVTPPQDRQSSRSVSQTAAQAPSASPKSVWYYQEDDVAQIPKSQTAGDLMDVDAAARAEPQH